MYDIILKQLEIRKQPIDVIIVGIGFMGFGFLSSIRKLPGISVPLVISRRPQETRKLLEEKGFKAVLEDYPGKIKDIAKKGYICISDDISLIKRFENNIVLDFSKIELNLSHIFCCCSSENCLEKQIVANALSVSFP